jgi:hypothetical protein
MTVILKQGVSGDEVEAWNNFLVGRGYYWLTVNDQFTFDTFQATKDFQKEIGLEQNGEVNRETLLAAIKEGFPDSSAANDNTVIFGANWPPPPKFPPLSYLERAKIFGTFAFKPAGIPSNPEAIIITDGWDKKNIVTVNIPQLKGVKGCISGNVSFHKLVVKQLQDLFQAWEDEGLLPLIKTFDGAWTARYIRGSRTNLSNHSYGNAFDLNYRWNMLGKVPALVDHEGSIRKLVPIANEYGFYSGMHFKRLDGMHFELAKIL